MLFILMAANYGLLVFDVRMIAAGSYTGVAAVNILLAWWGFAVVKRVAAADTRLEKLAYVAGGVIGSLIALRLTQ